MKYIIGILIVLCACSRHGSAQNTGAIDSLLTLLDGSRGIDRYALLYELTFEYLETDNEKALQTIHEAQTLAFISGDTLKIVKSSRIKAQILNRLQRTKESLPIFLKALSIARRHSFFIEESYILISLANACLFEAKLDQALTYHLQSLEVANKIGDQLGIAFACQNVGLTYYKLRDHNKALTFYLECVRILTEIGETSRLPDLWLNISLCYAQKRDFRRAEKYVSKVSAFCKNGCSKRYLMIQSFCNGVITIGLKKHSEAEGYFWASYKMAKGEKNIRYQLDNLIFLSHIYIQQHRPSEAERYLREAEGLVGETLGLGIELVKIYRMFTELYEQKDNWRKMATYQQKYIQLRDSIYNDGVTNNLMKIEAAFLERENKVRLAEQQRILSLNKEVIDRQRLLNIFATLFSISLIIITVLLVRSNQRNKMANRILDSTVQERTKVLEVSLDKLHLSFNERDLLIEKAAKDLRGAIVTVKGLCTTGLKDISEAEAKLYIEKLNSISNQLVDAAKNLGANAT